jgi:iron complex transport system ATP-binding protein
VNDAAVELEGVSASYEGGGPPALAGVTVRVAPGEVAAVVGPNGAGKSTLLRVAAGLLAPREGTARLHGADVRTLSAGDLARRVALVPQSEAVATGFRVREVVAMGRAPHQGGWMREGDADRAAIDDAMARCDLGALAERAVDALSGGEQKRVAVARALAQKPRVLLLDEPGAFLDVRHRIELYALLTEAAKRDAIACLVSMHHLDEAARHASRVVLLRAGRVLAAGAVDEVLTAPLLREAFDAEIDVGVHAPTGSRYFVPIRVSVSRRAG